MTFQIRLGSVVWIDQPNVAVFDWAVAMPEFLADDSVIREGGFEDVADDGFGLIIGVGMMTVAARTGVALEVGPKDGSGSDGCVGGKRENRLEVGDGIQ